MLFRVGLVETVFSTQIRVENNNVDFNFCGVKLKKCNLAIREIIH
jgi:hypothetical protein